MIAACVNDNIDEEVYSAWYDDWRSKRFAIEQRFLPLVEFALKGNLLSNADLLSNAERVLSSLQAYKTEVDQFYITERKNVSRIRADDYEYSTKKLPLLLDMLSRYERGTPQFEIFFEQINDDRARQNQFVLDQMAQVRARQSLVLQSFLSSKEKMIEQTGQITQSIAENYIKQQLTAPALALNPGSQQYRQLPPSPRE